VPEKSIRKGGPAEFAVVAGVGWGADIDRLPAKSTRKGGPAEFAAVAGVGRASGIDRLPAKSIRNGGPGGALDGSCAVASTSMTRGPSPKKSVDARRRRPIPKDFLFIVSLQSHGSN
jgi:hypothetical protein